MLVLNLFIIVLSLVWCDCDLKLAQACDSDFFKCTLFGGPANDKATFCACAKIHYGVCLLNAGCTSDRMPECVKNSKKNECGSVHCGIVCSKSDDRRAISVSLFIFIV